MTESTERLSVAALATAKGLPAEVLRGFGVSDGDDGVRFAFRSPSGEAGRTRLRTALRGVDGSSWAPGDTAPVVAYCTPGSLDLARLVGYQIVVEGESDCWTAWFHGVPAVGIPGSDSWGTLTLEHLPVSEVFIQVEADNARTYPGGVERYVEATAARIREIGFAGAVRRLRLGDGVSDLSDLYQRDQAGFADAVRDALARSRRANGGANGGAHGPAAQTPGPPPTSENR
ncbi:hypothetical protein GCM10017673_35850 [Streptosporangium violaceochromogenes]|nr:hypothetical protein GCM10017673_35850 [Streptosporangium violaceochromogenes]